jgi:hypothetical protein
MEDQSRPLSLQERLRHLAEMIPGYKGYMNRDESRNADKALRERIAQRLGDAIVQLQELNGRLSRELKLEHLGAVDLLTNKLRATQTRVEHAEYGFSGLFDATHIDETKLAAVYQHDLGLLKTAEVVVASAAEAAGVQAEEEIPAKLKAAADALATFDAGLREREYVLEGSQGA